MAMIAPMNAMTHDLTAMPVVVTTMLVIMAGQPKMISTKVIIGYNLHYFDCFVKSDFSENLSSPKLVLVPGQMLLVELAFGMIFQDILQNPLICQRRFCIQAVFPDSRDLRNIIFGLSLLQDCNLLLFCYLVFLAFLLFCLLCFLNCHFLFPP